MKQTATTTAITTAITTAVIKSVESIAVDTKPAVKPPVLLDDSAQYSTKDCAVHIISEDCIEVVFRIEGQDLKRYKSRMNVGNRNWAEYLWDFVLRRAILGHVY